MYRILSGESWLSLSVLVLPYRLLLTPEHPEYLPFLELLYITYNTYSSTSLPANLQPRNLST
jgi:hypothetical protein